MMPAGKAGSKEPYVAQDTYKNSDFRSGRTVSDQYRYLYWDRTGKRFTCGGLQDNHQ
jgi:hypothetical protein